MDPLSKQTACIAYFVSDELYLYLFVHIDFGILYETAHQDVGSLYFHVICTISPVYSFLLNLISEPIVFLLKSQFFNLLGTHIDQLFMIRINNRSFLPFELHFLYILGNLTLIKTLPFNKDNPVKQPLSFYLIDQHQ